MCLRCHSIPLFLRNCGNSVQNSPMTEWVISPYQALLSTCFMSSMSFTWMCPTVSCYLHFVSVFHFKTFISFCFPWFPHLGAVRCLLGAYSVISQFRNLLFPLRAYFLQCIHMTQCFTVSILWTLIQSQLFSFSPYRSHSNLLITFFDFSIGSFSVMKDEFCPISHVWSHISSPPYELIHIFHINVFHVIMYSNDASFIACKSHHISCSFFIGMNFLMLQQSFPVVLLHSE